MMDYFEFERWEHGRIELLTKLDQKTRRIRALKKQALDAGPSAELFEALQTAEAELQRAREELQEYEKPIHPPRLQFVDALCGGKLKFNANRPSGPSRG